MLTFPGCMSGSNLLMKARAGRQMGLGNIKNKKACGAATFPRFPHTVFPRIIGFNAHIHCCQGFNFGGFDMP